MRRQQVLSPLRVQDFPPELRWRTYLREWRVSGTQIRRLPDYLAAFAQLAVLHLPKNSIDELPPEMGESPVRHAWVLLQRPNASLPSAGKLVALKELNVSYNRLSRVPPELGTCTGLQRLELSGNHLCELPFEVRRSCR